MKSTFELTMNKDLHDYIKVKAEEYECTVSEYLVPVILHGMFYDDMIDNIELDALKDSYIRVLTNKIYNLESQKLSI